MKNASRVNHHLMAGCCDLCFIKKQIDVYILLDGFSAFGKNKLTISRIDLTHVVHESQVIFYPFHGWFQGVSSVGAMFSREILKNPIQMFCSIAVPQRLVKG